MFPGNYYKQKKALVLGLLMLFIIATVPACNTSNSDTSETKPDPVNVVALEVNNILENDIVFVSSFLEAEKTVPVSFLVSGKIVSIFFDEGSYVEKGQEIASLEIDDYKSHFEIAEADLLIAKDTYKRLQPLYTEGAIPEKDFIAVKAGLKKATAGFAIAKKKLTDTKLLSPVSGSIAIKTAEEGQYITAGMPIFTIVKTDKIYARVSIPESEIGKVKTDLIARITVPALDNAVFQGIVTHVVAMAEPRSRTYTAKIELDNQDGVLKPGMIAKAVIVTDKKIKLLTIPGKAVVRDADNLTYVFVINKETGKAWRKRIFIGSIYKNNIEVKRGLLPADIIITAGQHKLSDGGIVKIIDDSQKFATAGKITKIE